MVGYNDFMYINQYYTLQKELMELKKNYCLYHTDYNYSILHLETLKNRGDEVRENTLIQHKIQAEYSLACIQKAKIEIKKKEFEIIELVQRENWTLSPYEHFSGGT